MAQPIAVSKSIRRATGSDAGLSGFSTQEMYREILTRLGEDPDRDGLMQTPARVEKSMAFLAQRLHQLLQHPESCAAIREGQRARAQELARGMTGAGFFEILTSTR